ncbi:type IV toxin-antitoxin system AbiEi family antitoxin domain-containing protein, partial [Vicingaceae bacterium]|nr:type IV toxin-antitoxin system AbiEi family antitoxin domain-containing protein [Vicingaceae bacterium]
MPIAKKDKILSLLKKKGVLRPRELDSLGISRVYLNKLYSQGILDRPSRGLYTLPSGSTDENQTVIEACKLIPHGTICLLSALRFHDLTTQSPFEIWMAIDVKARHPKIDYPPVRMVRFSGKALTFGVQKQRINGVIVPVYSPAKTVADCFKYRNKIGLDVAIEALRDCRKQKKATNDEIWKAAKVCR